MEKFTLDEAFDKIYSMALEEKLQEDIESIIELEENNSQFIDALNILEESVKLCESVNTNQSDMQPNNQENRQNKNDKPEENDFAKAMNFYDKMSTEIEKRAKVYAGQSVKNDNALDATTSYKPIQQFNQVERIQDMKFPQNIIFFIKALVTWIKNNILNFIDKFSNIVRSLLGMKAGESRFTEKDLKLQLEKSREVETKYLVTGNDAYTKQRSFSDVLNGTDGKYTTATKTISLYNIPSDQIKLLTEEYSDINVFNESTYDDDHSQKAIMIDTSKDLFALRQSLEHFFDLFDQAYGSNDEKLFSIDDLEIMLQLFKNTYETLKNPSTHAMEIAGELNFGNAISATKLKDNLLRTKINTDNLKQAYVVTNRQINQLAQIIMNKNLLGATQMGVKFAFLSAATYESMIEILQVVDTRLTEAKAMEKKLQNMKKAYENLVSTLEAKRTSIASISNVTFTSIIERRINELYDGARYMTQTIQLRMSTLALYISELNDTRVILKNLNAIPENAFKSNNKILSKLKSIWA